MGGPVAEPMCRSSNVILDPTLALIRAQLGFRIKVRAECGNMSGREMSEREMF